MLALNNSADYVVLSPSIDDHLNRPHMPLGNANGTESVWNRTDVGQIDEVLTTTSFVCAVIMLIFCCVGVCGNLLSIYVYTRRTMTSSINVLLTGMSAVDLSVVVLAVPVFVLRGLNTVFNSDTVTHINSHNAS